MKRILKTWILTMMLCLGSFALFSQAASAHCASCSYSSGYSHGYSHHGNFRHHGYGYGYHHGSGCGYKYFKCKTYTYDCCSGCYYPVVTTYRTCTVPYQACSYDNCCCPKWSTYYKRYTYAVKTVKYHCPVRNYCSSCNSCY